MRYLTLLVLILAGCPQPAPGPQSAAIDYELAHVSVTFAQISTQSSPTPAPKPSEKCDNCRDVGWVGDGRVFEPCPVCNENNKKKLPKPTPKSAIESSKKSARSWGWQGSLSEHLARDHQLKVSGMSHEDMVELHNREHNQLESFRDSKSQKVVVMYTAEYCVPCKTWKKNVAPLLIEDGVKIVYLEPREAMTIPHFFFLGGSVHHAVIGTEKAKYEDCVKLLGIKK